MLNGNASKSNLKIAHIHVWDQKNKGDRAIVLAVQALLRVHFKNCRISNFPMTVLRDGRTVDIKKINKADFIIIGGGGIFYSYFLPYRIELIQALVKPIIIFGAGYIRELGAPALSSEAVASVVALAKKAELIGVRDYNTRKFLNQNGIAYNKIKVIGDPAALLSEKKPVSFKITKHADNWEPLKSGKNNQKLSIQPLRIGFNLNYSGWLGFGRWRVDILKAYLEVVNYFINKYEGNGGPGVEFYYLKHHPGEDNIYPTLKIDKLRVVDLKPAEQKYVYGQLDLVIGMMLHAGVLAFGAGTPEISVAYDLRNYSFAEFIKCPELVIDLDKLKKGELLKRVRLVLINRQKYRKIFNRQKMIIKQNQENFLKKINKCL